MSGSGDQDRIRVLLVISNLEYGGAQRQLVELANNMDPVRFDVHVCSLSDYVPLAAELRERERRLHVIHKRFKFDVWVVPKLARLMRRLNIDVVQGYLFDAEIATRLAGRLAGTDVIVGSERNTGYYLKRIQLVTYRITRGCVDLIIANSRAGAKFNQRMLGHEASQYRVIHNGVNVNRFRPCDVADLRRGLGIADDEGVVGMFASFKAQKNHPLLFAAARQVLAKRPRTRFMFVGEQLYGGMHGSDEYRESMERLVTESGIRERCLFLGNRDDVARLYCVCDLTVLPSLFEGTPNVLLESMACGVPVIATDVSDNAEIAPDGEVGFLVPLGDEKVMADRISRLLENRELRQRFGRQARSWMEANYSSSQLAAKTAAVFRAALADRKTGSPGIPMGNRIEP